VRVTEGGGRSNENEEGRRRMKEEERNEWKEGLEGCEDQLRTHREARQKVKVNCIEIKVNVSQSTRCIKLWNSRAILRQPLEKSLICVEYRSRTR
jgi:hypothetical protein